jgi:diacylglycerol kinase (ATP)
MVIFVNPGAGGGNALKKWKRFKEMLPCSAFPPKAYIMNGRASTLRKIREELEGGECEFVAAGGDGTVNFLLNTVVSQVSPAFLPALRFGAIGLGSSNDFHKPYPLTNRHAGIPTRINFASAEPRDLGFLTFDDAGRGVIRYFLVNASVGVTASANHFFNNPDRLLALLKRVHTPSAIIYAAFHTIGTCTNNLMSVTSQETGTFTTALTNIGIVKNPHFSGTLRYHSPIEYRNGMFDVHLAYGMSRREMVGLLQALGRGNFAPIRKKLSWRASSITLRALHPFAVEFDGEVIHAREVHFGILPGSVKVCTC